MTCWKWLGNQMTGDEMIGEWDDWLMKWLEIDKKHFDRLMSYQSQVNY